MDGTVYGIDAIDGRERWQTDLSAPTIFASPAVAEGTVFVSGYDDLDRHEATTYALDSTTGSVRWAKDLGQDGRTALAVDKERIYARFYFTEEKGSVFAVIQVTFPGLFAGQWMDTLNILGRVCR